MGRRFLLLVLVYPFFAFAQTDASSLAVDPQIASLEAKKTKSAQDWALLGKLYGDLYESEKAIKALTKALSLNPNDSDSRKRLIFHYRCLGLDEELVRQYQAQIKAAPKDPEAFLALARLYSDRKQPNEAQKILAEAEKKFAKEPKVLRQVSELYVLLRDHPAAVRVAQKESALSPKEESALVWLGGLYWSQNEKEKAQKTWKQLITIAPSEDMGLASYAKVLESYRAYLDASQAYQEASTKNPDKIEYLLSLAGAQHRARLSKEALDTLRAVLIHPKATPLELMQARKQIVAIYSDRGELEVQIDVAKRAFEAEPPDAEQGWFLVMAYSSRNRTKESLPVLEKLSALSPQDPEPLRILAELYIKHGPYQSSIDALHKLLLLEPQNAPKLYTRIAENLWRILRDEEALVYLEKAQQLAPNDAGPLLILAKIYEKQSKLPEAIASYQKAIALEPTNFEARLLLATLYLSQSRPQEASPLLVEVLSQSPKDQEAKGAAKLLFENYQASPLESVEKPLLDLFYASPPRRIYRDLLVDLYLRLTAPWIGQILYQEDPALKRTAEEKLHNLGKRALPVLSEALFDPDEPKRFEIIELMGFLKGPLAVRVLSVKLKISEPQEQVASVFSLGRIGDASVVPVLLGVGASSSEGYVLRAAAAWMLGGIQSPEVVSFLGKKKGVGLDDSIALVRLASALSLGRKGDKSVLPELSARLDPKKEESASVRAAAALALGSVAAKESSTTILRALESEADPQARAALLRALGAVGDERSIPFLLEAVFQEAGTVAGHPLYAYAVYALAHFGDPIALPSNQQIIQGINALDAGSFLLHAESYASSLVVFSPSSQDASVLLLRHKETLRKALVEALSDKKKVTQLRVLSLLDGKGDALALQGLLNNPTGAGMTLLQEAITQSTPALLGILSGRNPLSLYMLAIRVLGKAKESAAVQALSEIAQDPKALNQVRTEAAIALGRINTEESLSLLRALAKDTDWAARFAAARAFGESKDPAREADLLPLLEDPEVLVQSAAAKALLQIGGGSNAALPVLERIIKKPNDVWTIRKNIVEILEKSKDPKATALLQLLAKDPEPNVSVAAQKALQKKQSSQP